MAQTSCFWYLHCSFHWAFVLSQKSVHACMRAVRWIDCMPVVNYKSWSYQKKCLIDTYVFYHVCWYQYLLCHQVSIPILNMREINTETVRVTIVISRVFASGTNVAPFGIANANYGQLLQIHHLWDSHGGHLSRCRVPGNLPVAQSHRRFIRDTGRRISWA